MKYNEETSMNPYLIQEIQDCLGDLSNPCAQARLGGIATALHAFTQGQWSLLETDDGPVFISEDLTEAIRCRPFDVAEFLLDKVFALMDDAEKREWSPEVAQDAADDIARYDGIEIDPGEIYETIAGFIAQEREEEEE